MGGGMTQPVRIQRQRTKGWKMPPNTVSVTRPGLFGNHYRVWRDYDGQWMVSWRSCHFAPATNTRAAAAALAVDKYRADVTTEGPHNHRLLDRVPTRADIFKNLRGRNLACFCGLDQPCHVDVLLELANGPICEAAS